MTNNMLIFMNLIRGVIQYFLIMTVIKTFRFEYQCSFNKQPLVN